MNFIKLKYYEIELKIGVKKSNNYLYISVYDKDKIIDVEKIKLIKNTMKTRI